MAKVVLIVASRGKNTYRACRYALQQFKINPEKNVATSDLIVGNMAGITARELAAEFKISQEKKPRIKVNIACYAVSFPPGEDVDHKTLSKLAWYIIEKMGHSSVTQFFAVKHFDEKAKNDVSHFHIVASAIGLDGTVCKSSWDRLQARKVERKVEKEFKLTKQPADENLRCALTRGEYRQRQRTGEPVAKERLWEIIDRAAVGQPNFAQFFTRLHENGVTLKVKRDDKTKQILGVSYGFEDMAYSGYRLGRQYTYQGIQEHLGVRMVVDTAEVAVNNLPILEAIDLGESEVIDEPVVQPKAKKMFEMER